MGNNHGFSSRIWSTATAGAVVVCYSRCYRVSQEATSEAEEAFRQELKGDKGSQGQPPLELAAMEGRTKYQLSSPAAQPASSAHYQCYTVDRGLNSAQAVSFVVEGRDDALIDLAQCYLKTTFRVLNEDGSPLEGVKTAFIAPNYGANLWSSAGVSLNNSPLPPGNDYPYTARLIDLLGADPGVRNNVFAPLAGWADSVHDTSKIDAVDPITWEDYLPVGADSKEVTVYQRVHSDFLQTCSQLLPNRMQLGVTLTRGKDGFVLGRLSGDENKYKIDVSSVSFFVKRVVPSVAALARLNSSLVGGGKLCYQRLHTIAFPCAENTQTWNWHNCFNNVLPRRVFVALVTQESYFGSYGRICSFFESARVRSVRFTQDGREVLAEPYVCDFKYVKEGVVDWERSEAKSAYAGLCQTTGVFASPRHYVGTSYLSFVNGSTVFAVSLDHAAGSGPATGSLDVHLDFATPTQEPLMILVMGEYPRTLSFDQDRNLQ